MFRERKTPTTLHDDDIISRVSNDFDACQVSVFTLIMKCVCVMYVLYEAIVSTIVY